MDASLQNEKEGPVRAASGGEKVEEEEDGRGNNGLGKEANAGVTVSKGKKRVREGTSTNPSPQLSKRATQSYSSQSGPKNKDDNTGSSSTEGTTKTAHPDPQATPLHFLHRSVKSILDKRAAASTEKAKFNKDFTECRNKVTTASKEDLLQALLLLYEVGTDILEEREAFVEAIEREIEGAMATQWSAMSGHHI
ncbi:hypothetical protein HDV00_007024 [Rhizophlyctis rosea]|nr:hypothetical protein HDV00_007024 [Rhizophlyctis rosea]